ncbi:serine hydrolase domain-containing protein [Haloechinothrix sp. LS1_15]|uniref:serine hydrolase domain-containing protein n=1 Tax=Haloechinothrix sp. LS1_15 TaxID=2652248 RepID=UPI00294B3A4F|nr:serine hydrolase domain-containing protein [Haloechinothrix sp. LS1_15]
MASAEEASAPTAAELDSVQEALDGIVAGGAPAALAIVDHGNDSWHGVSGVRDERFHFAPRVDGRLRVASITKTFVAVAVLQSVADDAFGLDDDIADYLPGVLPYDERITVRQLLQHTSGIPRDIAHWESLEDVDRQRFERFTPEELIKLGTDGEPLTFPPGEGWSYSNLGYVVLGMLLEETTGTGLHAVLRERIIRPLRLRDTALVTDFPFLIRPAARGYEQLYDESAALTDVTTYKYSRVWASGNLVSSPRDLNRFFRALLGGELLPADELSDMKNTVATDGELGGFEYGLGLMAWRDRCDEQTWWGHGGDLPGYHTWSLHTAGAQRQVTTGMTRSLTASMESADSMINGVLPAALCQDADDADPLDARPMTELSVLGSQTMP